MFKASAECLTATHAFITFMCHRSSLHATNTNTQLIFFSLFGEISPCWLVWKCLSSTLLHREKFTLRERLFTSVLNACSEVTDNLLHLSLCVVETFSPERSWTRRSIVPWFLICLYSVQSALCPIPTSPFTKACVHVSADFGRWWRKLNLCVSFNVFYIFLSLWGPIWD